VSDFAFKSTRANEKTVLVLRFPLAAGEDMDGGGVWPFPTRLEGIEQPNKLPPATSARQGRSLGVICVPT
jgi:hypothetical protein